MSWNLNFACYKCTLTETPTRQVIVLCAACCCVINYYFIAIILRIRQIVPVSDWGFHFTNPESPGSIALEHLYWIKLSNIYLLPFANSLNFRLQIHHHPTMHRLRLDTNSQTRPRSCLLYKRAWFVWMSIYRPDVLLFLFIFFTLLYNSIAVILPLHSHWM